MLVNNAGESRHAVECGRAIDNIDIEESEESEDEVAGCCRDVPVEGIERGVNWVEAHNFLEKVKAGSTFRSIRKVGE